MVVETAILFPLLFLLWMCMLYSLFRLGSRVVGEMVSSRCIIICQELGLDRQSEWQQNAEEAARQYVEQSGMPIELKQVTVNVENQLAFTQITVEMTLEYSVWTSEEWTFSKTGYEIQRASLRNFMDFVWEAGEKLPVIGSVIQEYKDKLDQLRDQLGGS